MSTRRLGMGYGFILTTVLVFFGGVDAVAQLDLTELSLEELLNVEVTSVSRKVERRIEAAAAIYVVTADDIRRSGATSIPEALRLVPGVSVARLDANKWSVSIRGFSGRFANKLLVLVDGRSVYSPLFSGVYWETLDLPVEDIERIEVIRGPGGTIWGANAVNGVINVVTKHAAQSQGGLVSLGAGTEVEGFGTFRFGGQLAEDAYYRVWAKGAVHDNGQLPGGDDGNDAWKNLRGGLRLDWQVTSEDALSVDVGGFANKNREWVVLPFLRPPRSRTLSNTIHQSAGYISSRWTRQLSDVSDLQVQFSYERWQINDPRSIDEHRDTFDLEFQHRFPVGDRHDIVWGAGYRYIRDNIRGTVFLSFDPESRDRHLFSAFVQDEITLIDDVLTLIAGAKIEHNEYTGIEIQPSVRLAWRPADRHFAWAAVSRAVRTPSRSEDDIRIANMALPGALIALLGDRDFESEILWAFEGGYRFQPRENVSLDFAAFYNRYDKLRTVELRRPRFEVFPWPPHLLIPSVADNNMDANVYGVEAALDWRVSTRWRTRMGYTWTGVDMRMRPKTIDIISGSVARDFPRHQVFWWNSLDLSETVALDVIMRYVGSLPGLGVGDYLTADARLGWRLNDDMEFELVGQNLFQPAHLEYTSSFVNTVPTRVERGAYAKFTWRF